MICNKLYKVGLLVVFLLPFMVRAQDGPGGVGNSDGSDGQPANSLWLETIGLSYSDNDAVDTWPDLSGNSNDASQSSTQRPEYVSAGTYNLNEVAPVIRFDNSEDDFLEFSGNTVVGTDYTIFVVAAKQSGGNKWVMGGTTNSGANKNLHFGWDAVDEYKFHHWGNDLRNVPLISGDPGTGVESFGIMTLLNDKDLTDRFLYQNNQQIGQGATPADLIFWDGAGVDGAPQISRFSDIDVAEIIFYRSALNTAQRTIVSNYLSEKYNITIKDDFFSGTAGYDHFIAGIGKETNGAHEHASSEGMYISQNGGLDNNEYLFASNDSAVNNVSTLKKGSRVTNTGAEAAWNREWLLEPTGSFNVKIAFDFSEGIENGKYPQELSNYVLLYRANTSSNYMVSGIM